MSVEPIKLDPIPVRNTTSPANNYLSQMKPVPVPKKTYSTPKEEGFKSMIAKAWETSKATYGKVKQKRDDKKEAAFEKRRKAYVDNYDYDQSTRDAGHGDKVTPYFKDTPGSGRTYYKAKYDMENQENQSYTHGVPVYTEGKQTFGDRAKALNTKIRSLMPESEKLSDEQKKAYNLANAGANPMSQEPFQAEQAQASNYKLGGMRGMLGKASENKFFSKEKRSF